MTGEREPMEEAATCKLCGEPMPQGEEMFFYHGYSGPCPKPPLPKPAPVECVLAFRDSVQNEVTSTIVDVLVSDRADLARLMAALRLGTRISIPASAIKYPEVIRGGA